MSEEQAQGPQDENRMPQPARDQARNARSSGEQEKAEPGQQGRGGDAEREEWERERERDSSLELHERRPEFLTDEERVQQAEEIHRRAAPGYFPGVSDSTG